MSRKFPIIAVTGSSGSGTTTARRAFERVFQQEKINAVIVEGDSFHKYDRYEMERLVLQAIEKGRNFSHFGADANHFDKLERLFAHYSQSGRGTIRRYLHNNQEAQLFNQRAGTFTPWSPIPQETDLLFYEGLHGGVVTDRCNVAKHVDLLIGMVPTINLEWIQKINRDTKLRGYSHEAVTRTILRRMSDYVTYITPQFSRTHVNFQRVPMVDTSDPFATKTTPTPSQSMVVVHFRQLTDIDYHHCLKSIDGSFMSAPNTLVIPGSKMALAAEIILAPLVHRLLEQKVAYA